MARGRVRRKTHQCAQHFDTLVIAAVACSTLALPASAAAQVRDRDDRVWNNRAGGEAYQRGFRDGERLGEEDARRNRAFNAQSHREYREADAGYDRNDGSRDRYRDEFRRGFTEGYRVVFRDDRTPCDRRRATAATDRGGASAIRARPRFLDAPQVSMTGRQPPVGRPASGVLRTAPATSPSPRERTPALPRRFRRGLQDVSRSAYARRYDAQQRIRTTGIPDAGGGQGAHRVGLRCLLYGRRSSTILMFFSPSASRLHRFA